MTYQMLLILAAGFFLLANFGQDLSPRDSQSDREKNGYFGPVSKVSIQTETVSRQLYRASIDEKRELLEDTTAQFGNGRFLKAEAEFDEHGRLVARASSDWEAEGDPFRSVYTYDGKGQISEEHSFNRDGSPTGKKRYVYGPSGEKTEELSYSADGVLSSKVLYDDHKNIMEIESFGPDGSIVQKQSIVHSYRREGNTLEDSYVPPEPTSGIYFRVVSPHNDDAQRTVPNDPQQFKTIYTYNDAGQVIKEVSPVSEKNYDSKGRLSAEVFGNTRTTYSYDETNRLTEMLVTEPPGDYSLSGGHGRYIYKYDSFGNVKERIVYNQDGTVSMHYVNTYEYDSQGNWTKRIENERVFRFEKAVASTILEIVTVEYRAISYY